MYMYLQKLRNTLRHTFSMAYPTYRKEFQCELAVYKHKSICAIVLCPPTHKHATIAHSKPHILPVDSSTWMDYIHVYSEWTLSSQWKRSSFLGKCVCVFVVWLVGESCSFWHCWVASCVAMVKSWSKLNTTIQHVILFEVATCTYMYSYMYNYTCTCTCLVNYKPCIYMYTYVHVVMVAIKPFYLYILAQ